MVKNKFEKPVQTFISCNPSDSVAPVRVIFRYPYALVRKQNTLYFDKYTGKILKEEDGNKLNGYETVARANYDLHTGSIAFLGIGSKIVYFLASLFAASLPITGIRIWLGRKKKKKSIPVPQAKKPELVESFVTV